ncbi:hypothetical protein Y032_0075g919 [Ancylostoma ceylanicum]|uniref:Fibronectin type-III domain-containing protein n=1 Tax=Ancylostoma ceylanicum TaxID=53326 RepID=A0A016TVU7_9BILA|nr:hypothetical protein Y032_0075g919 [Ancylostoma ceylanicum]
MNTAVIVMFASRIARRSNRRSCMYAQGFLAHDAKFGPADGVLLTTANTFALKVQICEKQEDSPTCLRKTVPPRAGGAEFNDLKPAKIYYAQVACLTNAGKGLPSSWIAFRNADLTAPSITTTKKTRRPKFVATTDSYQDSTLVINIRAQEGLSLVIVWSFNTKGGALFDIGLIKKFQLLQYKKDIRGTYSDRLVITDDPKKREIDVGRYWRKQKTIGFVQKRETDEKNGHKKYDNKNITKNVKSCFDLDHG